MEPAGHRGRIPHARYMKLLDSGNGSKRYRAGGGQGEDRGVDRRISGAHCQDAIASTGQRSVRSPPGGAVL